MDDPRLTSTLASASASSPTTASESVSMYIKDLEKRLERSSDDLEDLHLEAAIDAQVSVVVEREGLTSTHPSDDNENDNDNDKDNENFNVNVNGVPMFTEYSNPNAVSNCLSPYVPSSCDRIHAFLDVAGLQSPTNTTNHYHHHHQPHNHPNKGSDDESPVETGDVLLDIGCGDGRVCVAATKLTGCASVGLDVSPLCISRSKELAKEEGLDVNDGTENDKNNTNENETNDSGETPCRFYELDATMDPDALFSKDSPISHVLRKVTVVYLFTYPSLLMKLIPLLAKLTEDGNNNNNNSNKVTQVKVITQTYHLPDNKVTLIKKYDTHDLQVYSKVHL